MTSWRLIGPTLYPSWERKACAKKARGSDRGAGRRCVGHLGALEWLERRGRLRRGCLGGNVCPSPSGLQTSEKEMMRKELSASNQDLSDASDEVIYKIDIPANRYDMLCLEGISRALNIFLGRVQPPNYQLADMTGEQRGEGERGEGDDGALPSPLPLPLRQWLGREQSFERKG